ncbi:TetR/AcrR family transcriptional regulator [Nocardia cyriacigeorgica]|uniref:TetR/AcrR family transcriptional regulator n=1 Tax=Nocardia cyriacigeorgica TaxID=135487 RepID=UPI001895E92F|nr:TetR/AcrR family transcriptional regulator [Nocardia cyriacigeorgica]MBF6097700.1 TetR/AcrR family transcriptional regulator [Nocardia cyriacigeorgica]MBF6512955.1 TetR/AcrR family transcriptional regulator [Nocardia cyriacigeorgica]
MARKQRADACRSRAAILDAAARILNEQPEASVEAIAVDAGVTRQTVYAHFPSRERLLVAALDRLTELTAAAMDAAKPDEGTAAEALLRVFDAAAQESGRYPALLQRINALPITAREDHARHAPITDRVERVIRRGQVSGEFDSRLPVGWLVVAAIHLAHAASDERSGGRMTGSDAEHAFTTSLMRILTPGRHAEPPRHVHQ